MVFSQPVDFYAISQCLSSSISLIHNIVTNTFVLFVFHLHIHFSSPFGQFGREKSSIKNMSIQNTLINSSRKGSLYGHVTGRGLSD